jgi:hypothetical protein
MWWLLAFVTIPLVIAGTVVLARGAANRRRRSADWNDLGQRGTLFAAQLIELQRITDDRVAAGAIRNDSN